MAKNEYVRGVSALGLALMIVAGVSISGAAYASSAYEVALVAYVGDETVRKGTALVTLEGDQLRIFGTFSGLTSPWVQADIYNGDPDNGGQFVVNLVLQLYDPSALAGGFDRKVTLTSEQLDKLNQHELFLSISTLTSEPENKIRGRIMLDEPSEATEMETPLSQFFVGQPVARGAIRAMAGPTSLRLVGFFNALASNWTTINVTRGALGDERTPVTTIYSVFDGGLYLGFDRTIELGDGWQTDFENGLYHIEVTTSQLGHGLQGQLLPSGNSAPAPTIVLAPADNETIVIGGAAGETPVSPDVLLGTASLEPTSDPDEQTVGYFLQFSDHSSFSGSQETLTYNLGVDTPSMPISVSQAAQIFDRFFSSSGIPVGVPKTIYVRGITTDGSLYAVGEAVQVTFIRGSITSSESEADLPATFVLHGNYPNPFNPGTKIQFDLDSSSDVTVTVFDMSGRQVTVIPVGIRPSGSRQTVDFDGSSLSSGTYLYRVVAKSATGTGIGTGHMTLLK